MTVLLITKLSIPFNNVPELTEVAQIDVTLDASIQVPAMSETEVMAKVEGSRNTGTWLLEGRKSKGLTVEVARALRALLRSMFQVHLMKPNS